MHKLLSWIFVLSLIGCGETPVLPPPASDGTVVFPGNANRPLPSSPPRAAPAVRRPGIVPAASPSKDGTEKPGTPDTDVTVHSETAAEKPLRVVSLGTPMREGKYIPNPETLLHSQRIIQEFTHPLPFPVEQDLPKLRKELRELLFSKSGVRAERPKVPAGTPANPFNCFKEIDAVAGNPKKMYAKLAEHLRLAEVLFEQADEKVRWSGLAICELTGYNALLKVKDPEMAALIADAWLMPHHKLATADRSQSANDSSILVAALDWYSKAGEWKKQVATACLWIQANPNNLNAADAARNQLSFGLEHLERYSDAAFVLQEIHDSSLQGVKERLPDLWRRDRVQREASFRQLKP